MENEKGDDTDGVGELCIKSPSLFKEYWKLPEVLSDIIYLVADAFFKAHSGLWRQLHFFFCWLITHALKQLNL